MAQDPLQTRLCEEYGCEYPIIAFAHTRDVTVAVSNAGGIGMLGQSTVSAEEMRTNIRWVKERVGDRPFGVDITIPSSYVEGSREELEQQIPQGHWDFIDRLIEENDIPEPKTPPPWGNTRLRGLAATRAKLEIMMEEQIPIFASGLGSPAFVLDEMHDAGVKVWGLIGLARQAARELDAGLDLIIAQGQDSAGHTGRMGTFSLVREVTELAKDYDIPIVAAGGITTGAHIVAALALGAVGVWTGTIWQATHESETKQWQKQRLLRAENQDAWVSTAMDGKRNRGVRNKYYEAWEAGGSPEPLPMPLQDILGGKLLQAADDWDLEDWAGPVAAGQGVGFVKEIKPARQVVFDLMGEAYDTLERMGHAAAGA